MYINTYVHMYSTYNMAMRELADLSPEGDRSEYLRDCFEAAVDN